MCFHVNDDVTVIRITSKVHWSVRDCEEVVLNTCKCNEADCIFTIYRRIFSLILLNKIKVLIKRFYFWITEFFKNAALHPECALRNVWITNVSLVCRERQDVDVAIFCCKLVKIIAINAFDVRCMLLNQIVQWDKCFSI